ncbi:hypothetical protein ACET3Z_032529 [Daucus carota]
MSLKRGAEVWSEISRTQQSTDHSGSRQSEPAYGIMTLEEFFVRAGVVREESARQAQPPPPPSLSPQLPQLQAQPHSQLAYGMHVNYENTAASSFMVLGYGGAGSVNILPPFKALPQIGRASEAACLPGGISSDRTNQLAYSVYGGGVIDNGCGANKYENISHVSSDGIGMRNLGRKQNGPVERVIENRRKKMMKNRESHCSKIQSKKTCTALILFPKLKCVVLTVVIPQMLYLYGQAYTIELEAELNHWKVKNGYLRHRLAALKTRSMQQNNEAKEAKAEARAEDKLGLLRRCPSSPF